MNKTTIIIVVVVLLCICLSVGSYFLFFKKSDSNIARTGWAVQSGGSTRRARGPKVVISGHMGNLDLGNITRTGLTQQGQTVKNTLELEKPEKLKPIGELSDREIIEYAAENEKHILAGFINDLRPNTRKAFLEKVDEAVNATRTISEQNNIEKLQEGLMNVVAMIDLLDSNPDDVYYDFSGMEMEGRDMFEMMQKNHEQFLKGILPSNKLKSELLRTSYDTSGGPRFPEDVRSEMIKYYKAIVKYPTHEYGTLDEGSFISLGPSSSPVESGADQAQQTEIVISQEQLGNSISSIGADQAQQTEMVISQEQLGNSI